MSEEPQILPQGVANGIENYARSQIGMHVNTQNDSGNYKIQVVNLGNEHHHCLTFIVTRVPDEYENLED